MKTLLYALALQGRGTKRLAHALTSLGLEGGHEIMGQGNYASVRDVPNFLANALKNSKYRWHGDPAGGQVGDNEVAWAFFAYIRTRFSGEVTQEAFDVRRILDKALSRFLTDSGPPWKGDPRDLFVDINAHLADFWPLVDTLGCKTRCIHLTRDGRRWVQKVVRLSAFTGKGGHYSSVHVPDTCYPPDPVRWWSRIDMHITPFAKACDYWRDMHSWFLEAGRPRVRVEDFNKPEIADRLLCLLYPEVGAALRPVFEQELRDPKYDGPPAEEDWDDAKEAVFQRICGDLQKKLGYE